MNPHPISFVTETAPLFAPFLTRIETDCELRDDSIQPINPPMWLSPDVIPVLTLSKILTVISVFVWREPKKAANLRKPRNDSSVCTS